MTGWSFLRSRNWLGYLALTVVFAIVCSLLGVWQFARRAEARAEITRVEQNWAADPVPIAEALPSLDAFDPDDRWLPVELTGHYLADEQLLARNRPLDSQVGFEVLVPFQLDDGSVFIVDRGWIAAAPDAGPPASIPAPPSGEVTVIVRLKPGEPTVAGRGAPEGQVATINLPQIAELLDGEVYTGAYGLLASEDPDAARPVAATKPYPDEGPHLSYALQWFLFALLGFVGLGFAARQEYRALNADDPAERERARQRAEKAAAKKTDAEIEDELLG